MAGQEPGVHCGRRGLWDDIVLVTGVEHGDVGGVLQRTPHEPLGALEVGEQCLGVLVGVGRAGQSSKPVEQPTDGGDVLARPRVLVDPLDGSREPDDGAVLGRHRAVAGRPRGDEGDPADALLGGLQQVRATGFAIHPGHRHAEPADLADGLGHAVEHLGVLLDHEVRALEAAGLLVGEEHDEQVPRRHLSGPGQVPDGREHHRDHVLHIDRASAPDAPVALGSRERVDLPVLTPSRHDVQVPVDTQPGPLAIHPRDPHDHGAAPRVAVVDVRLQPHLAQQPHDVLGRRTFTRPGPVSVVARIDPDQVLADPDHLGLRDGQVGRLRHVPHPRLISATGPRACIVPGRSRTPPRVRRTTSSGWRNWQTR